MSNLQTDTRPCRCTSFQRGSSTFYRRLQSLRHAYHHKVLKEHFLCRVNIFLDRHVYNAIQRFTSRQEKSFLHFTQYPCGFREVKKLFGCDFRENSVLWCHAKYERTSYNDSNSGLLGARDLPTERLSCFADTAGESSTEVRRWRQQLITCALILLASCAGRIGIWREWSNTRMVREC